MRKTVPKKLEPKFKIWLSTPDKQNSFGDGKWQLLKEIDATGSLQSACKNLEISYRKAWGDLKKAESSLNLALVERKRGGAKGGKTELTCQGKEWLKAYEQFHKQIEKSAQKAYKKYFENLKTG